MPLIGRGRDRPLLAGSTLTISLAASGVAARPCALGAIRAPHARHRPHTHALFAAWAASGRGVQGDGQRTIVPCDTYPALKSPPNSSGGWLGFVFASLICLGQYCRRPNRKKNANEQPQRGSLEADAGDEPGEDVVGV